MTRTLVAMKVSQTTFDEIAGQLRGAGYGHAFLRDGSIDMSEIGIVRSADQALPPGFVSVDPAALSRDEFRRAAGLDLNVEPIAECEVCGADCSAANPPVLNCPLHP